ncbi:MAG: penicillin-binding protein 2 [Holosporaceae bacterium]|jgi:penicillin-binding protein 2|nr:penicillin-binding protein 2 [Holosporaceae bacterium]
MFDDNKPENSIKFRAKIIFAIIMFLNAILAFNLYRLQIGNAEKYILLSNKNRIRLLPILPRRGHIITADGKIIAGNMCKYKLVMEQCNEKKFNESIDLLRQCIYLNNEDDSRIAQLRKKRASFVVIKDDLSWEEYSKLSMILFRLNCVSIENIYARHYQMPLEFSHVLGHMAKSGGSLQIPVGKTGVEAIFDNQLAGEAGNLQIEVNAVGKKVRIIDSQEPVAGNDIVISIDSQLQKYIYDLLSVEKAAAAVVLDVSNGEVMAMVSIPDFDPNIISNQMAQSQWQSIVSDPLFPLINRAVSCSYPPGSIFKIVVAFAALNEKIISPTDKIFCSGGVKLDDHIFHCWNRWGHGNVNLCDALKFSCDCYFFEIAKRLGIDVIVKYAKKFGFGVKTGIELSNENAGLLPSQRWKFLKYGISWKPYETMIIGIGQGALLATLLQSAAMLGKLCSGNYDFAPTLIKGGRKNMTVTPIDEKCIEIIKDALYQACTSGTASRSCRTDYGIFGKTGSSQVRKIKPSEVGMNQELLPWKLRDHAFFVGCAPFKIPRYVVAVFVEHGGGGAAVAAPIARKIFDRIMGK